MSMAMRQQLVPFDREPFEPGAFEHGPFERGVLRLTRRGRLLALVVVTVLLFAAFSVGRVSSHAATPPTAPRTIVVSSGDTLWSIAKAEAPGRDPRQIVDLLERSNHLAGSLQVGQRLVLPSLS
jgi:hypothetical protein